MLVDDPATRTWVARRSRRTGAGSRYVRETLLDAARGPPRRRLPWSPLAGGEPRDARREWDRWPQQPGLAAGRTALLVRADDDGRGAGLPRRPRVRRGHAADQRRRHVHDVQVSPDGATAYALRTSYEAPSHPVRIDLTHAVREPTALREPGRDARAARRRSTEVETTAEDGRRVRAWLALPDGASARRAGARSSCGSTAVRWARGTRGRGGGTRGSSSRAGTRCCCPTRRCPPATGQEFVAGGWGAWGAAPYTDLMAITDAVVARATTSTRPARPRWAARSAATWPTGWPATPTGSGRSSRTRACGRSTSSGRRRTRAYYWAREMTDRDGARQLAAPVRREDRHPDARRARRQGLPRAHRRGPAALVRAAVRSGLPADDEGADPHRFLYFPDENHWVLSPQHAIVWYQVVEAFLARARARPTGDDARFTPRSWGDGAALDVRGRPVRHQTRRSGRATRARHDGRTDMGIGGGIALIVIGAILSFGVSDRDRRREPDGDRLHLHGCRASSR